MRRFLIALGTAAFVCGCSTSVPSPTPGSTSTASAGAAGGTATIPPASVPPRPTPTPVPIAGCPTGSPITVREYVDGDPACFAGEDIAIRAWLDTPPPMGFEGPGIEPGWVAYPAGNLSALWQAPPTDPEHLCNPETETGCAWFFAHVDPASNVVLGTQRWIIVTGHVQDPAAETCHYLPVEDSTEILPPDAEAVAHCRAQFVLTAVEDAP